VAMVCMSAVRARVSTSANNNANCGTNVCSLAWRAPPNPIQPNLPNPPNLPN
jgi:hypothetical protein